VNHKYRAEKEGRPGKRAESSSFRSQENNVKMINENKRGEFVRKIGPDALKKTPGGDRESATPQKIGVGFFQGGDHKILRGRKTKTLRRDSCVRDSEDQQIREAGRR